MLDEIEIKEMDIPENIVGLLSSADCVGLDLNTGIFYRWDIQKQQWIPIVKDAKDAG